jgi:hypothetical protein
VVDRAEFDCEYDSLEECHIDTPMNLIRDFRQDPHFSVDEGGSSNSC